MSWTDTPIHFLDFEGNQRSGILEYGVATVLGGAVVSSRTRLCAARAAIRPEETAVHGLAEAQLAGLPPINADWDFFAGLRESGPFAAHFSGVENGLLKGVWPYPRTSPDFSRPGESVADWGPWIDTAPLCQDFVPGLASSGLADLVSVLGLQATLDALALEHCPEPRRRYHAALYDALAGALLLCKLARHPDAGALGVHSLLFRSTRNPVRRDAYQQGLLF